MSQSLGALLLVLCACRCAAASTIGIPSASTWGFFGFGAGTLGTSIDSSQTQAFALNLTGQIGAGSYQMDWSSGKISGSDLEWDLWQHCFVINALGNVPDSGSPEPFTWLIGLGPSFNKLAVSRSTYDPYSQTFKSSDEGSASKWGFVVSVSGFYRIHSDKAAGHGWYLFGNAIYNTGIGGATSVVVGAGAGEP